MGCPLAVFLQGISSCPVGFFRGCSVDTCPTKGPLQRLQGNTCPTRASADATGESLWGCLEQLLHSSDCPLRAHGAVSHRVSLSPRCFSSLGPLLQPPVTTKTLAPALNTSIYFPSTLDQNCLKAFLTSFALDHVTEKFLCYNF